MSKLKGFQKLIFLEDVLTVDYLNSVSKKNLEKLEFTKLEAIISNLSSSAYEINKYELYK